jgi:HSP20 family protein
MTATDSNSTNETASTAEQSIAPAPSSETAPEQGHHRARSSMFDGVLGDLDRWMDSSALLPFAHLLRGGSMARAPRIDVMEKDHAIIITAELPGAKKEDVHVDLRDGALVIRGETRAEHRLEEHRYVHTERSHGSFYRRLPLPFKVRADQIKATLSNGVLEVRIPEPDGAKSGSSTIPIS